MAAQYQQTTFKDFCITHGLEERFPEAIRFLNNTTDQINSLTEFQRILRGQAAPYIVMYEAVQLWNMFRNSKAVMSV